MREIERQSIVEQQDAVPTRVGTTGRVVDFCGIAALAAILLFAGVALVLQFTREDLDWIRTPLSFYLIGPYGIWLQAAYCLLGAALVLLPLGLYFAFMPQARSSAPVLLFVMAAVALVVTAFAHTNVPGRAPTFEGWVHGTAAQGAFLWVTTAMVLQAWRFRGDPVWRSRFRLAFGLAVASFAAVWILSLWRSAPRGLTQKLVIAMIVYWLVMVGIWLWRAARERRHLDASPVRQSP
jgi:hypothetical protein